MGPKFTRREFVKVAATSTLAAQGLGKSSLASAINVLGPGHTRRPNVIMIMLEDLGSIDANCYGSKDLVTPHMDALVAFGGAFHAVLLGGSYLFSIANSGFDGPLPATGWITGQCR